MTEINKSICEDDDLTVIKVCGKFESNDVIKVLKDLYKPGCTTNMLWDFSDADSASMTSTQMRRILSEAMKYASCREGGKTAIATSTNLDFGLSRMYQSISEIHDHPINHATFQNLDDALDWIKL